MKNPEALKQAMRYGGVKARVTTLAQILQCSRVTARASLTAAYRLKISKLQSLRSISDGRRKKYTGFSLNARRRRR